MIPNYLINDPAFSQEALCALVWMLHQEGEYMFRVADVKKRFGWGDWIWRRVSLELEKRGLVHHKRVQGRVRIMFNDKVKGYIN